MASTLNLQNSVNFTAAILKNQRLNVNNLEPGLTMGNIVLQTMLAAPFIWRFNRANFQIAVTAAAGTDYTISLPTLGRIEEQWITDSSGNTHALGGSTSLAKVSSSKRPTKVAPVYDDNNGNITFRFDATPDATYTAWFDYQQKAPLITSYAQTFGPVPDEFGYLFNKGMLSEGALLTGDARFTLWRREFVAGILATQDGLDDQAKSIFYDQMLNVGRTATRSQGLGKAGQDGRLQ